MQQLVEVTKCKTLFITHYPLVASNIESQHPLDVQNLHMGYDAESRIDGTREITFLYRLTSGMATGEWSVINTNKGVTNGFEHRVLWNRVWTSRRPSGDPLNCGFPMCLEITGRR